MKSEVNRHEPTTSVRLFQTNDRHGQMMLKDPWAMRFHFWGRNGSWITEKVRIPVAVLGSLYHCLRITSKPTSAFCRLQDMLRITRITLSVSNWVTLLVCHYAVLGPLIFEFLLRLIILWFQWSHEKPFSTTSLIPNKSNKCDPWKLLIFIAMSWLFGPRWFMSKSSPICKAWLLIKFGRFFWLCTMLKCVCVCVCVGVCVCVCLCAPASMEVHFFFL